MSSSSNPVKKPRASRASAGGSICTPERDDQAITLCMRKTGRRPSQPVTSGQDACNYVRGIATSDRENMHVLHLDVRNRVIGSERVAIGTLDSVEVHPREVFKGAILNNASRIILAHNHPSGLVTPSKADIDLTKRLGEIGKMMGIPVLDHVIVGTEQNAPQCHSLRQVGDVMDAVFGADFATSAKRGRKRARL